MCSIESENALNSERQPELHADRFSGQTAAGGAVCVCVCVFVRLCVYVYVDDERVVLTVSGV